MSTKVVVLVLLPNAERDYPSSAIEERMTSLKKTMAQTEHFDHAKTYFLVQNGLAGLKSI
jgi:hypothetical protein